MAEFKHVLGFGQHMPHSRGMNAMQQGFFTYAARNWAAAGFCSGVGVSVEVAAG